MATAAQRWRHQAAEAVTNNGIACMHYHDVCETVPGEGLKLMHRFAVHFIKDYKHCMLASIVLEWFVQSSKQSGWSFGLEYCVPLRQQCTWGAV